MKKRAQVAVEYVIVVGIAMLITIPLFLIYYSYSSESEDYVTLNQLNVVSRKIIDSAESLYVIGEPARTEIKVFIPGKVYDANISQNEVIFYVNTQNGQTEVTLASNVNITGTLPSSEGIHHIVLEAQGDKVWIGK